MSSATPGGRSILLRRTRDTRQESPDVAHDLREPARRRTWRRSVDFFTGLGFTFNQQFTDENATCMVVSDAGLRDAAGPAVLRAPSPPRTSPTPPRRPRRSWRSRRRAARRSTPSSTRRSRSAAAADQRSRRTRGSCTAAASTTSTATPGRSCGWTRPRSSSSFHTRNTSAARSERRAGHPGGDHDPRRQPCCSACVRRCPTVPGRWPTLARHCGEQGVNILGLQIFPGVEGVTDELVLRAPGLVGAR